MREYVGNISSCPQIVLKALHPKSLSGCEKTEESVPKETKDIAWIKKRKKNAGYFETLQKQNHALHSRARKRRQLIFRY